MIANCLSGWVHKSLCFRYAYELKKNTKDARITTHAWTQIPTIRRCLARILSMSATYAFGPGVSWAVHDCCWIFRGFKVRKKLSDFWGKLQRGFPHIPFFIISRIPEMVLRSLRSIRMPSVSAEMDLPSDLYIILGTKCSRALSFQKISYQLRTLAMKIYCMYALPGKAFRPQYAVQGFIMEQFTFQWYCHSYKSSK